MSHKLLKIYDGRGHFWQWDKGQRLIILDDSITAVHLSHKGESSSKDATIKTENNMRICDIPDVFLQIPKNLVVYVVRSKLNNESTITAVEFAVKLRAQPDGYMSVHDNEYSDIDGRISALEEIAGMGITIDQELSETSENPVQNKVIAEEIQNLNTDIATAFNRINSARDTADAAQNTASNALNTANNAGREAYGVKQTLGYEIVPKITTLETQVGDIDTAISDIDERVTTLENEGGALIEGAVLYTEQTLTNEQKAQVRENIGAVSEEDLENAMNAVDGVVKYDEQQELTEEQKAQARKNIGAAQPPFIITVTTQSNGEYISDMSIEQIESAIGGRNVTRTAYCNFNGTLYNRVSAPGRGYIFANADNGIFTTVHITAYYIEVETFDCTEECSEYIDKKVDNVTLSIKNAEEEIDDLQETIKGLSGAMHFEGVVQSDPTASTFNIDGYQTGDVVIFGNKEFVFNDTKFVEFGDATGNASAITELDGRVKDLEDAGVVLYTTQSLAEEQKAQARANIGAGEPITVDDELIYDESGNPISENPVQNKVVAEAIQLIGENTQVAVSSAKAAHTRIDNIETSIQTIESTATLAKNAVASLETAVGEVSTEYNERITGLETSFGDIDAALDSIIALQQSLIGGDDE